MPQTFGVPFPFLGNCSPNTDRSLFATLLRIYYSYIFLFATPWISFGLGLTSALVSVSLSAVAVALALVSPELASYFIMNL